ncbi:MAG: squalene/phytoene synthase family protein [Vicinamibacterales bacterium]
MSRDTSFSYSFLVLPAAERRAVVSVWDFCRAVDDAVDEEPVAARAAERVSEWRDEVDRVFARGGPSRIRGATCAASSSSSGCRVDRSTR